MDETNEPETLLLNLKSPEIFHCPFMMMTEPGGAYLDDEEAKNLRDYLLKGGFLWADDFWGDYAWDYWESMLRKALPSATYPIVDLPRDHPIFHQVLNAAGRAADSRHRLLGRRRIGRGNARAPSTTASRAINDDRGRIMVLMTLQHRLRRCRTSAKPKTLSTSRNSRSPATRSASTRSSTR